MEKKKVTNIINYFYKKYLNYKNINYSINIRIINSFASFLVIYQNNLPGIYLSIKD